MPALLTAHAVHKRYVLKRVLRGVDLELDPGDALGLVGRNGEGKSTLLKCLVGLEPFERGQIRVFGQDPRTLGDAELARLAYVAQGEAPFPDFSARDYVRYLAGFYPSFDVPFALGLLKRWDTPLKQPLQTLSLGQRQRVEVARALGVRPQLLLLDEPLSGVDPLARRQVLDELVGFARLSDCAVLFTTHILSDIEQLGVELALLRDGQIQFRESISSLKSRYALVRRDGDATEPRWAQARSVRPDPRGGWIAIIERDRLPELSDADHLAVPTLEDLFVELGG
jgi:ABC-2 type transport system ATP-binding protein